MFGNIAWSEILIIAGIALVVIGPKELPAFLRVVGRYFGKLKGVADDFKTQFDDVVRETQVNDIKDNILKEVEGVKAALPSEKDIGLDFSELDADVGKSKAKFDDEDENLDWDEPDEVIETSADGEVTHHSKKEEIAEEPTKEEVKAQSSEETVKEDSVYKGNVDEDKAVSKAHADEDVAKQDAVNQDGATAENSKKPKRSKKSKKIKNSENQAKSQKASNDDDDDDDDYDFDEDEGALLDEEHDGQDNRTSMDVLAEGREKFKESLEEAKASKAAKSAKHAEAEAPAANG